MLRRGGLGMRMLGSFEGGCGMRGLLGMVLIAGRMDV